MNSGSEANDMAMMMARMYTGNYDLLTLRNAYHGLSAGTMGLLSHSTWKFNTPTVSTCVSVPLSLCGCAIPPGKVHDHSIHDANFDPANATPCLSESSTFNSQSRHTKLHSAAANAERVSTSALLERLTRVLVIAISRATAPTCRASGCTTR